MTRKSATLLTANIGSSAVETLERSSRMLPTGASMARSFPHWAWFGGTFLSISLAGEKTSPTVEMNRVRPFAALSEENSLQLVSSRIVRFIDSLSLEAGTAREILFRNGSGFILYLSDDDYSPAPEERLISLELREALIWLNEDSDQGSFWT